MSLYVLQHRGRGSDRIHLGFKYWNSVSSETSHLLIPLLVEEWEACPLAAGRALANSKQFQLHAVLSHSIHAE